VLPDEKMYRTAGLQVQFFRVTRGEPLTIEGRVISKSNTTIAVEADFRTGDELIAKASALQIMRPLRKSL
jgi:acyl-coenzyme A thioesterase PaaI-like protein